MPRTLSRLSLPCLFLLLSGAFFPLVAQQTLQITGGNTPPFTPDNLIRNVLLGEGVEVTSVTFKGKPVAVGYFTGGSASIGLERGIIMTTGSAKNAVGNGNQQNDTDNASTASDADLSAIVSVPTHNMAVYEIAFIPTADTLRFRYCFASEEYPEFACQAFNDVFAFFIQGPGYPSPTNIARVPGTGEVVSINTLHPAYPPNNCPAANAQYFNSNQNKQPIFDGFTDIFTAEAIVTPCQLYTIKLAIADVGDEIFDSGVFLEAKSFGTGSLKVALSTLSVDATIAEGCTPATITFSLPLPLKADFPIDFSVGGTATQGTDYQSLPGTLTIPAGQTSISVPIHALADNLSETGEYIALDVQRDPCNRDTLLIYIRDNALQPPTLPTDTTYCLGSAQALILNGTLPLPTPQPPSFSNTNDFAVPDDDNQGIAIPIQVFGIQPATLGPGVIRSVCLNATHPWIDDLDLYLISPGGQVLELSTDNGQNGMNYTATCFTPTATKVINFPGPFAPASAAPFTGDWLPEGPWSDLWDGSYPTNGTWKLQATDDQITLTGTVHDCTITFEPSYKINYQWSPATGLDCSTCPQVTASPAQPTQYTLTASDSYGCTLSHQIGVTPQTELAAPSITCGAETANSLTFNWTAVSGANTYEVNVGGSGWLPANGNLAHTHSPVPPGAILHIQVRGLSGSATCPALIGSATCTKCVSPALQVLPTAPGCAGSPTGKISVSVPNPLNPPYTYSVGSQSNSTGIFEGLAPGSYTVTVTDAQGCSNTQSTTISPALPFSAAAKATAQAPCFGVPGGSAVASGSGGTAPYTYRWSNGDSIAQVSSLLSGLYWVTLTDAQGCTATASTSISQPDPIRIHTSATPAKCFGENSGSAQALASAGQPPYTYFWPANGGVQQPDIQQVYAGIYFVSVTDARGCHAVDSVEVKQPDPLSGTAQPTAAACYGTSGGKIVIAGEGGTSPYRYTLNGGAWTGSSVQFALPAGVYVPSLLDRNGCTVTLAAVTIAQRPPIVADLGHDLSVAWGESLQLSLQISQATPPYLISWPPADSLWLSCLHCPDPWVDSLLYSRHFSVTVTDSAGCAGRDEVYVQVLKERRVYVPTGFTPNGDGSNDRLWPVGQTGVQVLDFQVYDRWGELVFEARDFALNNPDRGWDGLFRGTEAQSGAYVWIMQVQYIDGSQDLLRGESILIR